MDLDYYPPHKINEPFRFGDYELVSLLGEGGMGQVFKAWKVKEVGGEVLRMRRPFALKIPSVHLLRADPTIARQMVAEARAALKVNHANVVGLEDVGEIHGIPYLAMDLLEGEGLEVVLTRGALPGPEVLDIGIAVAAGLSAIHAAGLVHRDLKPSNVFMLRSGEIKILDLGIAKAIDAQTRLTGTGMSKGTPGYMAPEQLVRGAQIDAQVDVFALGALLAEAALGEPVFYAESLVDLLMLMPMADEHVATTSVAGRVNAVHPGLGDIVGQCMRKAPERRPAGADDVRTQIAELSAGKIDRTPIEVVRRPESAGVKSPRTEGPQLVRTRRVETPLERLTEASSARGTRPLKIDSEAADLSRPKAVPKQVNRDTPHAPSKSKRSLFVAVGGAALMGTLVVASVAITVTLGIGTIGDDLWHLVDGKPLAAASTPDNECTAPNRSCTREGLKLAADGDHTSAVARFKQACDNNETEGCVHLGIHLKEGRGHATDLAMAVSLFRKACNNDDAFGCRRLGLQYRTGEGVPRDQDRAAEYCQKACDLGDSDGCFWAESLTRTATPRELHDIGEANRDAGAHAKAVGPFKQACDGGHAPACEQLGRLYYWGYGVALDQAKAVSLFTRACNGGNGAACHLLGIAYLDGNGVKKDEAKAIESLRKSCNLQYENGCKDLKGRQ